MRTSRRSRATARAAATGAAAALLLFAVAAPATAQQRGTPDPLVRRGGFTLSLQAGGSAFTTVQDVTVERSDGTGEDYPSSLAVSTSTAIGGEATYWFREWLGLRLQAAYVPSEFELRMQEADRDSLLGPTSGPNELRFSGVSIYNYDLLAVLSPVIGSRTHPYLLVGGGASSFIADSKGAAGLDSVFSGARQSTSGSALLGAGLRVPLKGGRVALSFELTNHLTRSPVPGKTGRELLDDGMVRVVDTPHPAAQDDNAYWLYHVSFFAGLTFAPGSGGGHDAGQ